MAAKYCKDCPKRIFTGGIPPGTPPYLCGVTKRWSKDYDTCSVVEPVSLPKIKKKSETDKFLENIRNSHSLKLQECIIACLLKFPNDAKKFKLEQCRIKKQGLFFGKYIYAWRIGRATPYEGRMRYFISSDGVCYRGREDFYGHINEMPYTGISTEEMAELLCHSFANQAYKYMKDNKQREIDLWAELHGINKFLWHNEEEEKAKKIIEEFFLSIASGKYRF